MNRRDLLKGMAALPAAAALGPIVSFARNTHATGSTINTLNMIFEGPFLFLLQQNQVRVLGTKIDRHLYIINGESAAPGEYSLQGARGAADVGEIQYNIPPGAEAFALSARQLHLSLNREKQPYFIFDIPTPKRIIGLYYRQADIVDAFGSKRTVSVPSSYALVYDVADANELALPPDKEWRPNTAIGHASYANLLIATGLPRGARDASGEHWRAAYAELHAYLPGLRLQILRTREEERLNVRLLGYPGPFGRSSVPDCGLGPFPPLFIRDLEN